MLQLWTKRKVHPQHLPTLNVEGWIHLDDKAPPARVKRAPGRLARKAHRVERGEIRGIPAPPEWTAAWSVAVAATVSNLHFRIDKGWISQTFFCN